MANDFNPQVGIVGTPSGTQVYTPPVDNTLGQAFSAGARMLDTGLDFFKAAQKSQAQAQATQAISGYSTEVGTLQSSYEQGRISRTQLDAQRRMAYREYSRKFPNQIQEFGQIEKQMFGYSSNAKEEAIVQAGLNYTQKAMERGYMIRGTDISENEAIAAGSQSMQQEQNIEFQGKQLKLAHDAYNLDETVRKDRIARAEEGLANEMVVSIADQANSSVFQKLLEMKPEELQRNAVEATNTVARQKALYVMRTQEAFALAARNGIPISAEAQRQVTSSIDTVFGNMQTYIDTPSAANKKMFDSLKTVAGQKLYLTSELFAMLTTLGDVAGPLAMASIIDKQGLSAIDQLRQDTKAAIQFNMDTIDGKINLENVSPEQKAQGVGTLQKVITGPIQDTRTPEKDVPTFVKALRSFTTAMDKTTSLSDKMGGIQTLTSPEFIRNLSFAKGKIPDSELAGIGQAITAARTVLMQEINRVMSTQNPNEYGQNVLGLNPADAEGNFSLNMEPPEAVNARAKIEPIGKFPTPAPGVGSATPQIQESVDKLNKLNTVLKLLGEQGPPQATPTPAGNLIGIPPRATGQTKIEGGAGQDRLTGSAGSDNALLDAVRQVESGGNNKAISPKGALGPYQVMPATAKNPGYGIDPLENPTNPKEARKFATEYLTAMKEEFGGNPYLAVLAYNAGPGPVKKWLAGKGNLPQETIDYAKKIIRSLGGV